MLVNLDMPWNPAVLDQRIARVHRLGQRETVQTIIMVSSPSYEEHVMGLVKGKRHLFDNVIDPDASEDVVGVSKKLLETLSDDLEKMGIIAEDDQRAQDSDAGENAAPDLPEAETTDAATDDSTIKPKSSGPSEYDLELENRLRHCIVQLQELFGSRIERVLGSGGGLLVILDQVTTQDDWQLEEQSLGVPVALLDPRTLRSLQKLGDNSPLQEASSLYDVAEEPAEPQIPRLQQLAQEKLQAAEVLMEQGIFSVTLNMLVNALLQSAAAKAELEHAPSEHEAAVWLYGEAIPNGWLDQEQAGLISQALALTQAPDVPETMLAGLLVEARKFVES